MHISLFKSKIDVCHDIPDIPGRAISKTKVSRLFKALTCKNARFCVKNAKKPFIKELNLYIYIVFVLSIYIFIIIYYFKEKRGNDTDIYSELGKLSYKTFKFRQKFLSQLFLSIDQLLVD